MKSLFSFIIVSVFIFQGIHAQIIFEEYFEDGTVPSGWAIQTNASDGGWKVGSSSSLSSSFFKISQNGSLGIAATNDDACNCNKTDEYFISPPIDLTNESNVLLKFDAYFIASNFQGKQEEATIEVSTDGINWTILENLHGHASWDTHMINLSDYAGEATVYIGFRYDDDSGWLYGFAIDNVIIEIPFVLDAELVEVSSPIFGETGVDFPIKGVLFNDGITTINSIEVSYSINGAAPISELIENIDIPTFTFANFETSPWVPSEIGPSTIKITIEKVNGEIDQNTNNNFMLFDTEIYEGIIIPDKIDDLMAVAPVLNEVIGASALLNRPTDLDFYPILGKDELWIVNQRTENTGGSTVTISNATKASQMQFAHKVDGNSWHFMSLPTAIAFSSDNLNFATSTGVQDANHSGGTFTGPTLWSSDPLIYAQPSGGNGSHLDMLHGSPFSMGIAHEVDNVFWVYDNWNKDIVRYDFVEDHGPGNDYHGDAIIRRYKNIGIAGDGDIPSHLILDKSTNWLYFVDNGNDRVIRLDISSGFVGNALPEINEALAEHSQMAGFNWEVIIDSGLEQPCGIEIFKNRLLVGDYSNGDIIVYDMDDFSELGRIPTNDRGLTGIKVGPDGNIWCTNRLQNTLTTVEPGERVGTHDFIDSKIIDVYPNPTSGILNITYSDEISDNEFSIKLSTVTGDKIYYMGNKNVAELNLEAFPSGMYFLTFSNDSYSITKKLLLTKR